MRSPQRSSRTCSRASCGMPATKTLTYIYSDSTAVLGPLAMYAEPHSYDLCAAHSEKLTVPNGWTVVKSAPDMQVGGPSDDDLMAIADAVREVGQHQHELAPEPSPSPEIGRRGHLRGLPSS